VGQTLEFSFRVLESLPHRFSFRSSEREFEKKIIRRIRIKTVGENLDSSEFKSNPPFLN